MNLEFASQHPQSFLHTSKTDTSSLRTVIDIKASSLVSDAQVKFATEPFQTNLSPVGTAMTFDISKSFLDYAKERAPHHREYCEVHSRGQSRPVFPVIRQTPRTKH